MKNHHFTEEQRLFALMLVAASPRYDMEDEFDPNMDEYEIEDDDDFVLPELTPEIMAKMFANMKG